jgi:hypothetical protein
MDMQLRMEETSQNDLYSVRPMVADPHLFLPDLEQCGTPIPLQVQQLCEIENQIAREATRELLRNSSPQVAKHL